ncbi:melanoma-associated antigen B1-like [Trichechus manatus latirostris]|uniref:Melanoma-associated antigen B1-like n=1 Tax=Trichechus manatus latirostris TaxID=127582 RepID=A0A2Y9ECL4_TRIMA|nr:melanoma-associated antigen B1-like [Trichechus manatus latirostris]
MPRGQKSKLRAREKRQHVRGETQGLKGAQATAVEEEGFPSSCPVLGDAPESSHVAGILQESEKASATTTPAAAAILCKKSDGSAKSQDEESPSPSQATPSTESSRKDPLTRKASMLVQFFIEKYKMKEPIMKADMLKLINRKYKQQFPEILRRATERMELIFGLELKETNPSNNSYDLISQLDVTKGGSLCGGTGLPKTGLLMTLLGMIFVNGNRATEKDIWEFLNALGIYAGRSHVLFGEPRKFITKDLVQDKYLEYRQVPNSDPPCYEFLWGPRSQAETTKMKVLEFMAKYNDTVPSSFPALYEEALRDEKERAGAKVAATASSTVTASASFRAKSSRFSSI